MARFSTRRITLLESPKPCPACGHSMRISVSEPDVVYCDRRACPEHGVMRKES